MTKRVNKQRPQKEISLCLIVCILFSFHFEGMKTEVKLLNVVEMEKGETVWRALSRYEAGNHNT